MIVDVDCLYRLALHVDVPDLEGQVVTSENIPAVTTEANIGD